VLHSANLRKESGVYKGLLISTFELKAITAKKGVLEPLKHQ
jgi:hypothetical protein